MIHCFAYRHAQTEWNKKELIQGNTKIPLNKTGIKQAETVKKRIPKDIEYVYSSDFIRAYQTAKILFPHHRIYKTKYLREIDFGEYNGKNRFDVRNKDDFFNNILNNPKHPFHLYTPFPKGEAAIESFIRLTKLLIKVDTQHPKRNIALITHCDLLETLLEINKIPIPHIDFVSKIEFDFDSKEVSYSNFLI